MEKIIKLSIIIPTRNRCDLLKKTLDSLTLQSISKSYFEVIVVDNGSVDNTKQVTESFLSSLDLKYVYEQSPGLHIGRHAGLRESNSDILVFIDDDIEAFPVWLETIFNVFEKDEEIAMVGGKNLPKYEVIPPFWILEMWNNTIEHGHVLGDLSILDFGDVEKTISPYYIFGCNFSIRKKVLLDSGGFHPDGMPFELIKFRGDGETYVSQYVLDNGFKSVYHPNASVYHWVSKDRMTQEYFCKRRYMQGVSEAFTHLKNIQTETEIQESLLNKFKFFLKVFLGIEHLRILNQISINLNKSDFDKKLNQSYINGYNYLTKCYKQDIEIRNWIHRNKYY
jgi:glycosyltransferase involved in cell wall biosynthesis